MHDKWIQINGEFFNLDAFETIVIDDKETRLYPIHNNNFDVYIFVDDRKELIDAFLNRYFSCYKVA